MTGKDFMKAIAEMHKTGELDKLSKWRYSKDAKSMGLSRIHLAQERKKIKKLKEHLDCLDANGFDIGKIPFVPFLCSIDSAEVLKDTIFWMVGGRDV